jgi:hypothetical protein
MNSDIVKRDYYCRMCDQTHEIYLSRNIAKTHSKFPVTHIFLHGELKNLLTTLYIDKDLQIRGVDVHELHDGDIFSKEHVTKLISTLMGEIERLQKENNRLIDEIHSLKKEFELS